MRLSHGKLMVKRRPRHTVSLVNQLTLLIVLLGITALLAMSISNWIAQNMKGSAYAINQLGTLRMKSYQLLSLVPLDKNNQIYITQFDQDLNDAESAKMLDYYALTENYHAIQTHWHTHLRQQFLKATHYAQIQLDVADFVTQLDLLVRAVDQKTEQQITRIAYIQKWFIVLIVLVMSLLIYYLRYRLLKPWNLLVNMAHAIASRDFSTRYQDTRQDELGIMGQSLNHMSDEISMRYADLEQRVSEKTQELQTKNQIVTFLYNSLQKLQTNGPLCERFLYILRELEQLTPLSHFQIHLYEPGHHTFSHQLTYHLEKRPSHCQHTACHACLIPSSVSQKLAEKHALQWYLEDKQARYGVVTAQQTAGEALTDDHQRIISTLLEQMTLALVLEQQTEYQKQLLLVQERSAIARELHDSIAQSLSCLKLKISCLQMFQEPLSEKGQQLLIEMRKEINVAYSQLRELLTTFRLNLDKLGLYASLEATLDEFNAKLGFNIDFEYNVPLQAINSHQAIHVLQIVREALNNAYKHAKATQIGVIITHKQQDIVLTITDNGVGMSDAWQKEGHYGIVIMQDRASNLEGTLHIKSQLGQGTSIGVTFRPNPVTLSL